ncbi:MAG: Gfo/Idh/MocA family protein [Planctomycetaceae bacterium]
MSVPHPALSRRQFLGSSARNAASVAAGMAASVVPWTEGEAAATTGTNDRLQLVVVGVRQQGLRLALELATHPEVAIHTLVDVDASILDQAVPRVAAAAGVAPATLRRAGDLRDVLAQPGIDGVVVATPDHWHLLQAAWVLEAGLPLYLEAPLTHNLVELHSLARLAEQAEARGVVTQAGLPHRSAPHVATALAQLSSGAIGPVHQVRAWTVHQRPPLGRRATAPVPAGVDYDLWLGPAAERPFHPHHFHHNWQWHWQYGSGELGHSGVQWLDLATLALGGARPAQVLALGAQVQGADDDQAPDTLLVHYRFPGCIVSWEHRLWSSQPPEGRSSAIAFQGEQGTLIVDRGGWKIYGGSGLHGEPTGTWLGNHLANFVDAIRGRAQATASLSQACLSTELCHWGSLAYRSGQACPLPGSLTLPAEGSPGCQFSRRVYRAPWAMPCVAGDSAPAVCGPPFVSTEGDRHVGSEA